MIKKMILLLILSFCPSIVFALQGQVVMLDVPLFKTPNIKSPIIQYKRKGDLLFVQEVSPQNHQGFYKTLTTNATTAYVLKEHIRVLYQDPRELNYTENEYDSTDYRLKEPLPPQYPFRHQTGYRGMTSFSLGNPNHTSYQYRKNTLKTQLDLAKAFHFVWSKKIKNRSQQNIFWGVMSTFQLSAIKYLLDEYKTFEENFRISTGPYLSFDIYQGKKSNLSLYTSTQITLLDQMKIVTESSLPEESETRRYKSNFNFYQVLGTTYQYLKAISIFDLTIGTQLNIHLPKDYKATNKAKNSLLWQDTSSNDLFKQSLNSEISFFLGLQTSY